MKRKGVVYRKRNYFNDLLTRMLSGRKLGFDYRLGKSKALSAFRLAAELGIDLRRAIRTAAHGGSQVFFLNRIANANNHFGSSLRLVYR
ncbi:hypothetical protein AZE99_02370 [Sphingorhabdus sp. M41]|nr:hypothetical protein AZE99_02370 [Sphingorhabdus sp. M41]